MGTPLMCGILKYFLLVWLHLWHIEVPRLGVKSELQLLAYATATATATATAAQLRAVSATYTAAHSNAGSLTH